MDHDRLCCTNVTPNDLRTVLRKLDFLAEQHERSIKTAHGEMVSIHRTAAENIRRAMSVLVDTLGADQFAGRPYIDFRIPLGEEV